MDPLHGTFGTHRNSHCNRYMVFLVWRTCQERRRECRSIQMKRCMVDCLREVCSTTRKLLSWNHLSLGCIGTIPNHRPNIWSQCIPLNKKGVYSNDCFFGYKKFTYAHKANEFFITNGFVGLIDGWGTIRPSTIAETGISASIIISAFITKFDFAIRTTTWPLQN